MSDIPIEMCREVLSRLPVLSLLRFKTVCKAWRNIIDDPDFIKYHLDRQLLDVQDFSNGGNGHLIVQVDALGIYLSRVDPRNCRRFGLTPFFHNPWERFDTWYLHMLSCNGLLLFSRWEENSFMSILWNPSTRESRELHVHNIAFYRTPDPENFDTSVGFGYDRSSDDYKVVNVTLHEHGWERIRYEPETMVYGLKSDSWRRIKDFPCLIDSIEFGVFLNGSLHWLVSAMNINLIVGLDLGTEDYFQLALPDDLSKPDKFHKKVMSVLGGSIAVSCLYFLENVFDVWVLNDYRGENSWTKLFSLGEPNDNDFCPIIYSRSRGQVLLENKRSRLYSMGVEFLYFDLENKTSKEIISVDANLSPFFLSTIHVESLVWLNGKA